MRYKAFTLAEVLVTLAIIGVVVVMTLTSVINITQDKQFKIAYKKAYSSLSQAFLSMKTAGEYLETAGVTTDNGELRSSNIGKNFKTISKYFKAAKTCFNNNADDCWELKQGEQACQSAAANNWVGCYSSDSYAFVDASGMGWYLYSNSEWPVLVDVNGKKKPNKLGKDRFVMMFASNDDRNNYYPNNADMITPWYDITNKCRWCPSGNCLYKSWLFE